MRKTIREIKKAPKVVVIIDMPWTYEREFLLGISQYSNDFGPWSLYVCVLQDKRLAQPLDSVNADGIIAFTGDTAKNMSLVKKGVPAIVFTDDGDGYDIPTIQDDEEAIGKIGAEHLLERRFKSFAFYGYADHRWSKRRSEGFRQRIAESDLVSSHYETSSSVGSQSLENELHRVAIWLKSLPKPVGLMACDDENSLNAVEACNILGIPIPEDVAILGVDNDHLLCNLSYPPRSSVVLSVQAAGYETAQLLDRFMKGKETMMNQKIVIRPSYVVTRLSTDTRAVEDTLISKALQLIRDTAAQKIQTSEIAEMLGVSCQFLNRHFKEHLNHSVHEEIRNAHIKRTALVLREKELSNNNMALRMGYKGSARLGGYFKQAKGITP